MEKPDEKERVLREWARITLLRLAKKIKQYKVSYSDALLNSLTYDIISATGGDKAKIVFLYNFYGMFVDMGVGRGVSNTGKIEHRNERRLESNKHLGRYRKPKKWYSPTMFAEVITLADLLMENFGTNMQYAISEKIENKIKMST